VLFAVITSETSVSFYQTAWCNIPEDVQMFKLIIPVLWLWGLEGRVNWMVVNVGTDLPSDRSYSR
jgi:hypothetical protein